MYKTKHTLVPIHTHLVRTHTKQLLRQVLGLMLVLSGMGFAFLGVDVGRQTSASLMEALRIASGTQQMVCACICISVGVQQDSSACIQPSTPSMAHWLTGCSPTHLLSCTQASLSGQ